MNISCVKFEDLTKEQIDAWSEIQRSEPLLASPYFRPEFTQAVAAVRKDIEVAVLTDGARLTGFLPFQRSGRNAGYPVGFKLSDFHGLIAPADIDCDARDLLRSCGLRNWHFDNLLSKQRMFSAFIRRESGSPFVDLSEGMEAFIARRENGRRFMSRYGQVGRKLAREIGPLRFEPDVSDPAIVSTLLDWKTDQLRQMRVANMFHYSWVRNLLEKVCEYNGRDFSPVISVLYAGDKVAAISIAMRTSTVLHGWLQAYNVDLAHHSPGTLCCIEIMKAAQSLGIRRFDFGRGPEGYKYRIMSDVTKVAEGTADVGHGAAVMRRTWWSARELVRSSPIVTPARALAQKVHRARHWLDVKLANRRKCT